MPRYPCCAHNRSIASDFSLLTGSHVGNLVMQRQKVDHSRGQEEHIDCVCGVTDSTPAAEQYNGLWLQCDECMSWLHGACVGYPKRPPKGITPAILPCSLRQYPMLGFVSLHTIQALPSPCSAAHGVQSSLTILCHTQHVCSNLD